MSTILTRKNSLTSSHPSFRMFEKACATNGNGKTVVNVQRLERKIGALPADAFTAANTITSRLLEMGWKYNLRVYQLPEVLHLNAGNCLGFSCLYGALLESRGFQPEYELVVGPKGFQSRDEQTLLDYLLAGHAFSFNSPLLPERPARGEKLLFYTLEHPRLVLDGRRFETTTLREQGSSDISGERVRKLSYSELVGLVCYERAHSARCGSNADYDEASRLLSEALARDPKNHEVYAEQAELTRSNFDDDAFMQARKLYSASEAKDSKYWLQRYDLFGDMSDLDRALVGNPTDMRAWTLRHVIHEGDTRSQRANFAVAAQCVARSEIWNLGDFYTCYASTLARLFPNNAVSLVKRSRDKATDAFEYHLALSLLGTCQNVRWIGLDTPRDHLAKLEQYCPITSPYQKTRQLFVAKRLSKGNREWMQHCSKFGGKQTFQATVAALEQEWA